MDDGSVRLQGATRTLTALDPRWRGHQKELRFKESKHTLTVPLSACVSAGDTVISSDEGAWVLCTNGTAHVSPSYISHDRITLGRLVLDFLVKEITEPEEFQAYLGLTRFHYRGKSLCGRTARLVVCSFDPAYPKVLGYVELASPFYMNKARSRVFDAPFQAPGVAWQQWNTDAVRQGIHSIVRIARLVVFPEFRGIGLGQRLVRHAIRFARERWQMARVKPCFLEISADMLRFVPFAEKAGMVYIGETEGNLHRVVKDMGYLVKNARRVRAGTIVREEAFGIVDQQVSKMNRALNLMKDQGWDLNGLLARLGKSSSQSVLRDHSLFGSILSLPKPTYSIGLGQEAQSFLSHRVTLLGISNGKVPKPPEIHALRGVIRLSGVSISYRSKVRRTHKTHAIERAFGISPDDVTHDILSDLNLSIGPAEVILITGSSGSGKTSVMRLLADKTRSERAIKWPRSAIVGHFRPLRSKKALIDALSLESVERALYLMGVVGLSDAYVYLKRFDELSNGQQYRAMLAKVIAGGANVWLADEFCSNLDPVTANVVGNGIQRLARQMGAALVVASSQPQVFAHALRPDRVLQLTTANGHTVSSGADFLNEVGRSSLGVRVPSVKVRQRDLRSLRAGRSTMAFVRSLSVAPTGLAIMVARSSSAVARIVETERLPIAGLAGRHARAGGFATVRQLREALRRRHPGLRNGGMITALTIEPLGATRLRRSSVS